MDVCDALTHVKKRHKELVTALLKEEIKAKWQQISDYGFRGSVHEGSVGLSMKRVFIRALKLLIFFFSVLVDV